MAVKLAMIFFSMILVNNYVLVQFLGICPFLGVSKKLDSAVGMSAAVIFVMALATSVTWPIYTYLLEPNGMAYLQTIVFILIIAVLVQLVEIILKKFMPPLYKALGVYLPLITTNCAVLGVTISVLDEGYNFAESLVCAVGAGVGFMVAMVRMPSLPSALRACPSRWWRQASPACPSWASAASSKISSRAIKEGERA